jgi:hypothetical protein
MPTKQNIEFWTLVSDRSGTNYFPYIRLTSDQTLNRSFIKFGTILRENQNFQQIFVKLLTHQAELLMSHVCYDVYCKK